MRAACPARGGLVAQLYLTLMIRWTAAGQTPLSMGCSRQEYCRGRHCSPFRTVPAMTTGRGLALSSLEELCRFSPHLGQSLRWALGDRGQAYTEASTPSSRAVLPLGFKFCHLFTTMTAFFFSYMEFVISLESVSYQAFLVDRQISPNILSYHPLYF